MAVYRRVLLRFSHLYPQFQPASELSSQASTPPHLSPSSPLLSPSRLFAFCSADRRSLRVESPLGFTPSGLAREGTFSRCWNRQWCSTVGAILIGQAAIFLGLCNESASAHDHSVGLGATSNEQAEENAVGLQRIEDGSVISNEHTAKWRIFTDNARDFLLKRNLDEAEIFFWAALHEAKEGFGLRDPHVASALNNLAEFYRLKKEYGKAELLYVEAIEILEESFGSDDIRVGTALHSLGICYHLQCKLALAQTCYERALKIEGRVMGVGNPEYASTVYLLGKASHDCFEAGFGTFTTGFDSAGFVKYRTGDNSEQDMEKGKKSGSGRGYISWNDDMDKALLDTFVECYNKGDRCQNGWKSHVYTTAIKNVREKCNGEITKDNIMSRNKTFDKHHTIINGMLETSGFGWDWNKNKISVDSDCVWEAYVAEFFLFFVVYSCVSDVW